jgi:glycine C-acetyltransferase
MVTANQENVYNLCANNYLGLANHPRLIEAAKSALDNHGFGMASVRFICGTQDIHLKLEKQISDFFDTDDTILYSSCFDANGGLFETILNDRDAIISDELNHASIIDGIRLSKSLRFRYKNNDMLDLEKKLIEAKACRLKIIATDGVFSMDGQFAKLNEIVLLAEKHNAMVMVDDSHATGFIGEKGKGSAEYFGVMDKIDIFTSTLGKALGGASGGFTTGRKEIIELLRQKSRPYLFSNSVAPSIVGASIAVLDIIESNKSYIKKLRQNTKLFRNEIKKIGFEIKPGNHPIIPIMLYDDHLAQKMSDELLKSEIYVIGFFYPVVPIGQARIRVQITAAHSNSDINKALSAFKKIGKKLKVIK